VTIAVPPVPLAAPQAPRTPPGSAGRRLPPARAPAPAHRPAGPSRSRAGPAPSASARHRPAALAGKRLRVAAAYSARAGAAPPGLRADGAAFALPIVAPPVPRLLARPARRVPGTRPESRA